MEALLTLPGIVFLSLAFLFQVAATVWAWRCGAGTAAVLLVALFPLAGIPLLLIVERERFRDNHVAGAITYLALLHSGLFFLFWYPKMMDDDIPWALIHTMQFFAFLGVANLVATPSWKRSSSPRRAGLLEDAALPAPLPPAGEEKPPGAPRPAKDFFGISSGGSDAPPRGGSGG